METTNKHADIYLHDKVEELENEIAAERKENIRLRLRIEELEHQNKKYHQNLQRFAPGEPTVKDY